MRFLLVFLGVSFPFGREGRVFARIFPLLCFLFFSNSAFAICDTSIPDFISHCSTNQCDSRGSLCFAKYFYAFPAPTSSNPSNWGCTKSNVRNDDLGMLYAYSYKNTVETRNCSELFAYSNSTGNCVGVLALNSSDYTLPPFCFSNFETAIASGFDDVYSVVDEIFCYSLPKSPWYAVYYKKPSVASGRLLFSSPASGFSESACKVAAENYQNNCPDVVAFNKQNPDSPNVCFKTVFDAVNNNYNPVTPDGDETRRQCAANEYSGTMYCVNGIIMECEKVAEYQNNLYCTFDDNCKPKTYASGGAKPCYSFDGLDNIFDSYNQSCSSSLGEVTIGGGCACRPDDDSYSYDDKGQCVEVAGGSSGGGGTVIDVTIKPPAGGSSGGGSSGGGGDSSDGDSSGGGSSGGAGGSGVGGGSGNGLPTIGGSGPSGGGSSGGGGDSSGGGSGDSGLGGGGDGSVGYGEGRGLSDGVMDELGRGLDGADDIGVSGGKPGGWLNLPYVACKNPVLDFSSISRGFSFELPVCDSWAISLVHNLLNWLLWLFTGFYIWRRFMSAEGLTDTARAL
jgi:hypothetical protein